MPDLQVNRTYTRKNYDDNPLIDGQCHKIYPSVSYDEYGYIFIWFCPIHGHTMVFISLMVLKAGKILFVLYSSTKKKCQITYFITLPAHYLSIASTGLHLYLQIPASGKICSILLDMCVETTSNQSVLRAWRG